jgi:succinylglutamate desuccinylase
MLEIGKAIALNKNRLARFSAQRQLIDKVLSAIMLRV